jgi:hypothetical protein
MDGILGLGRGDSVDGTIEAASILEVLSSAKLISAKLYGIHLSRASDGTNDGELNLGEPNKERYTGDLNWLDTVTNDRGFWEIGIADAGIVGTSSNLKGRTGIIDTGTSFILMPQSDAVALHNLIKGSSQSGETFTVPCDTKTDLQFTFGSTAYNISSADWVGGTLSAGGCQSNIIGRQTFGETQWLLGDVFLKNVYTVFDFDDGRVGFGVKSFAEEGEEEPKTSTTGSATKTSSSGEFSPTVPLLSSTRMESNSLLTAGPSSTTSPSSSSTPTSLSGASPVAQNEQAGGASRAWTSALLVTFSGALGLFAALA